MRFRLLFLHFLALAVASIMRSEKFNTLKNKYLTLNQNTIEINFIRSQVGCAAKCSEATSCCMASYLKSAQACFIDISGSCEEPLFDVDGWVALTKITNAPTNSPLLPKDCDDIPNFSVHGVYTIYPTGSSGMNVYCAKSTTFGGVWTVIQKRYDGSVNFYRNWTDYKTGFGTPITEYWLGNDNLHLLTDQSAYMLIVDIEDWNNTQLMAKYETFHVGDENSKYLLKIQGYWGNAGDALNVHDGHPFSTYDNDNDEISGFNCAEMAKGGFWYYGCQHANLNGLYITGGPGFNNTGDVMAWGPWHGLDYSLRRCTMMVRKFTENGRR